MKTGVATSLALLAFALATPACAAGLTFRLVDERGKPVSDAVVIVRSPGAPAPRPLAGARVVQQNTTFVPFVTVVPQGSTVAFPNLDPFRHHVYSFSPAKRFEIKLFAKDQGRSITFDKPGVVAVGCNIHDSMSAYIVVADSPWAQRSGANGTVAFHDLPAAGLRVEVWHPFQRTPGASQTLNLAASAGDRVQTVTLRLRPPPMHDMGGY